MFNSSDFKTINGEFSFLLSLNFMEPKDIHVLDNFINLALSKNLLVLVVELNGWIKIRRLKFAIKEHQ